MKHVSQIYNMSAINNVFVVIDNRAHTWVRPYDGEYVCSGRTRGCAPTHKNLNIELPKRIIGQWESVDVFFQNKDKKFHAYVIYYLFLSPK